MRCRVGAMAAASQVRPVAPKVCRESGEAADIAGAVVETRGPLYCLLESESDDGYTKLPE